MAKGKRLGPGKLLGAVVMVAIILTISIASVNQFIRADRERVHFQQMTKPNTELLELRTRESKTLNSFAVIDEETGVYRIPVSLAMELEVEEKGK